MKTATPTETASYQSGQKLAGIVYGGIATQEQFTASGGYKQAFDVDPLGIKLYIATVEEQPGFNIQEFVEGFVDRVQELEFELGGFANNNKAKEMVFRELNRRHCWPEAYGYTRAQLSNIMIPIREIARNGISHFR